MVFDIVSSTLSSPLLEEKTELDEQLGTPWKVIVLNDPVNLMNYVVMVFKKVFGYNDTKATKHMMEMDHSQTTETQVHFLKYNVII